MGRKHKKHTHTPKHARPTVTKTIQHTIRNREQGRDRKILSGHRQDGNVAIGGIGIGNLARWGLLAVSEMQAIKQRGCTVYEWSSVLHTPSRLTRDGTAQPVSRDQILRRERGQGDNNFSCSASHEQDLATLPGWSILLLCVMTIHTYYVWPYRRSIHTVVLVLSNMPSFKIFSCDGIF